MNTSIAEAVRGAAEVLDRNGVADARREAGALLSHVIGKDRTFLISHAEDPISEDEERRFEEVVRRRAGGEPSQYIIGTQDFFGRVFRVTPAVLIPRPETELLVEAALEVMAANSAICDVGTGSGCIAITLLCERGDAQAVALDISEEALNIARENAREQSVGHRMKFVRSDCFTALNSERDQFDLIVSNPPYVPAGVLAGLQREVRDHEPQLALSPGADGLSVIRRLLVESPAFIRGKGYLIIEIGFDQSEQVKHLVDENVWELKEIRPDLQCIPRLVVLRRK
jgi:release factor glutamine methyltransferase